MKKVLIAMLLAGLAAYVAFRGIERYNYINAQVPLPPIEFNAEEKQMIESLVIKCAREGIIDTASINEREDGPRCMIAMCGEKTAYAEFPEAPKLLRECYENRVGLFPRLFVKAGYRIRSLFSGEL